MLALLLAIEPLDHRRSGAAAEPVSTHRCEKLVPLDRSVFPALAGAESRLRLTRRTASSTAATSHRKASSASIRQKQTVVPDSRSSSRCRRQRAGGREDARGCGAAGDLHRMESFNPESVPAALLSSMQGSYIPLARTRADRDARTRVPGRPSKSATRAGNSTWPVSPQRRESSRSRAICSKTTSRKSSSGRAVHWSLATGDAAR